MTMWGHTAANAREATGSVPSCWTRPQNRSVNLSPPALWFVLELVLFAPPAPRAQDAGGACGLRQARLPPAAPKLAQGFARLSPRFVVCFPRRPRVPQRGGRLGSRAGRPGEPGARGWSSGAAGRTQPPLKPPNPHLGHKPLPVPTPHPGPWSPRFKRFACAEVQRGLGVQRGG